MTSFLTDGLWERVTALSKKASRRHVAVAWLARGASELLHLDDGDTLVVNMSDASVKTGCTDPREVASYLDRGVRVFSVENLHAKVFVFDETVVVGSSNVSNHSARDLVEAAIEIVDGKVRAGILRWIRSLALAPVTPELAKAKLTLYKPPAWGRGRVTTRPRGRSKATVDVGRLWIVNTQPRKRTSPREEALLETQAEDAKDLLADTTSYSVETIRYHAGSRFARGARLGDLVVVIHSDGPSIEVYPPARFLMGRRYTSDGAKRIGVHLESRDDADAYYWRDFKRSAAASGLAVRKYTEREVRDPAVREGVLRFFT